MSMTDHHGFHLALAEGMFTAAEAMKIISAVKAVEGSFADPDELPTVPLPEQGIAAPKRPKYPIEQGSSPASPSPPALLTVTISLQSDSSFNPPQPGNVDLSSVNLSQAGVQRP